MVKTLLCILLLIPALSNAADVYVSTTGTKTSGKSTTGIWTNANCYGNLVAALTASSGGDTITLDDGTYTGSSNLINQYNYPKSGTAGAYTVIRARNIPCQDGYPCASPLKVNFSGGAGLTIELGRSISYVKIWGLSFKQMVYLYGITSAYLDHWYFKQCAVQGDQDGNPNTITIATRNSVFEDVIAYGKGRYKFAFYDFNREGNVLNNVCRRCIVRNDYSDAGNDPSASFVEYYAVGTKLLNVIDIDDGGPSRRWTNEDGVCGSFAQVVYKGATNYSIKGSIAINTSEGLGVSIADSSAISYTDVVGVKIASGLRMDGGTTVNRLTLVDVGYGTLPSGGNNGWAFPGGLSAPDTNYIATDSQSTYNFMGGALRNYYGSGSVNNSILRNVQGAGVATGSANGDYINTFLIGNKDVSVTHHPTTDPKLNGLLYPVRIEPGSALKTAGAGGGQIGAEIMYKLGYDGAEYGSANVETPNGNLWPWPLEDWVKAQLANADTTVDGTTMPSVARGFASPTTKRLDGINPVTLTSYIWESLGNAIPTDIYGASVAPVETIWIGPVIIRASGKFTVK